MNYQELVEQSKKLRLTTMNKKMACIFPVTSPTVMTGLYEYVLWEDLPELPEEAFLRVVTLKMSTMSMERVFELQSKSNPGLQLADHYVHAVTNAQYGLDVTGSVFKEYTNYVNSGGKPVISYEEAVAILKGDLPHMVTEEWREDMLLMIEPIHLIRSQEEELYKIAVATDRCTDELEENRAIFLSYMAYENMLSYIWM